MDPPMASGNWIPELIKEIGGNAFFPGKMLESNDSESQFVEDLKNEGRSREFDLENLKEFDPEYIFMHICGAGENLSTKQLTEREDWQDLTAVKKDQVFIIDDNLLNRPGPRLVEGAKRMESKFK